MYLSRAPARHLAIIKFTNFNRYKACLIPRFPNPCKTTAQSANSSSASMGATWSLPQKQVKLLTVEQTAIHSAPTAKYTDPLHLSILFEETSHRHLADADNKGRWEVDLEIDVAHFKTRYRVLQLEADLQKRFHRIDIPQLSFREVAQKDDVTVDTLCNISAIHASLFHEGVAGGDKVVEATIVLDLCREGYDGEAGFEDIVRRVYGVTDRSQENV